MFRLSLAFFVSLGFAWATATAAARPAELSFFEVVKENPATSTLQLRFAGAKLNSLQSMPSAFVARVPVLSDEPLVVEMELFSILTPQARIRAGFEPIDIEPCRLYRGTVAGEPGSLAYLAVGRSGLVNGLIERPGHESIWLATPRATHKSGNPTVTVTIGGRVVFPEAVEFCGSEFAASYRPGVDRQKDSATDQFGPRLAVVAYDSDKQYSDLFAGDTTAALDYMQQLLGVISLIFERDFNVCLRLDFLRVWPNGGEPFIANDIDGFLNYWNASEDTSGLHAVQMLSGSRTPGYGGIAYVSGTCGSSLRYGISAYLNGMFPSNWDGPNSGTYDIIVSAHEFGHTFGAYHTHDYLPPIDECPSGVDSRGTIMSYCHLRPGGLLNIDPRFHQRVSLDVEAVLLSGGCHSFDCNGNSIEDSIDIATATSVDTNSDGIPDECQDCDGNSVLDSEDIAGGAPDVDGNGVPDICQDDCDMNGVPDEYQTRDGTDDADGNGRPDICDPDCNSDGTADHITIALDPTTDIDRNRILDECEDCNGNGVPDWMDVDRAGTVFIQQQCCVLEHHAESGVEFRRRPSGAEVWDMAFGPDRRLYQSNMSPSLVFSYDPFEDTLLLFYTSPGFTCGAIAFDTVGDFYVAERIGGNVFRIDGVSGVLIDTFVVGAPHGVLGPRDIEFGPNGNLFVLDSTDAVFEFEQGTGAFVRTLVASGAGGLNTGFDMAWKDNGNLLIASYDGNRVIEYDSDGTFVGVFSDSTQLIHPRAIEIGPDGNVFVTSDTRIMAYSQSDGRSLGTFIWLNTGVGDATRLKFMPASPLDCNGNLQQDSCDIAQGVSEDLDSDGIPDECTHGSGCCIATTGNVSGDAGDEVNLTDLTVLVNHLFVTFEPLPCPEEANTSGDPAGDITLTDLTVLVNHLFVSFEPLPDCQ